MQLRWSKQETPITFRVGRPPQGPSKPKRDHWAISLVCAIADTSWYALTALMLGSAIVATIQRSS